MTVADSLSTGVDNLFECSVAVRFTFLLIPVAMVFQFCGISTGVWSDSDESSLGLWGYCYTSGDLSCCQNIADKFGDIPGIYFLSIYLHSADRHYELYSIRKKVQYPPFSQPIKMYIYTQRKHLSTPMFF